MGQAGVQNASSEELELWGARCLATSLLRRTWQLSESHPLQCRQQLATELRDGVGSSTNRNAGEDPSGLLPSELTAAPPKG